MNTGFRLLLTGRLASSRTVAGRYQVRANHGGFRPNHGPPNRNISDDFGEEASYGRFAQNVQAKKLDIARTEWGPSNRYTLFYDGGCPLCTKEIRHYMNLHDTLTVPVISFYNIDSLPIHPELERRGITNTECMKRIHALDEGGTLLKNFEAFQQLWLRLPYWKLLGMFGNVPGVAQVANYAYGYFAERRFKWRSSEASAGTACSIKQDGASKKKNTL